MPYLVFVALAPTPTPTPQIRRAPSRHCRKARVYGSANYGHARHDHYTPLARIPPIPLPTHPSLTSRPKHAIPPTQRLSSDTASGSGVGGGGGAGQGEAIITIRTADSISLPLPSLLRELYIILDTSAGVFRCIDSSPTWQVGVGVGVGVGVEGGGWGRGRG